MHKMYIERDIFIHSYSKLRFTILYEENHSNILRITNSITINDGLLGSVPHINFMNFCNETEPVKYL